MINFVGEKRAFYKHAILHVLFFQKHAKCPVFILLLFGGNPRISDTHVDEYIF